MGRRPVCGSSLLCEALYLLAGGGGNQPKNERGEGWEKQHGNNSDIAACPRHSRQHSFCGRRGGQCAAADGAAERRAPSSFLR